MQQSPQAPPPAQPQQARSKFPTGLVVGICCGLGVLLLGGIIWGASQSGGSTGNSSSDGTSSSSTTGTTGSTDANSGFSDAGHTGLPPTPSSTDGGTTSTATTGAPTQAGLSRSTSAILDLTFGDGTSGSEYEGQEVKDDGSYDTDTVQTLSSTDGKQVTVETKDWYDSAGVPVRMEREVRTGTDPNNVSKSVATFDANSAHVSVDGQDYTIDRPSGAPTTDLPDLWFVLTKPVPGAEYDVCEFSIADRTWSINHRKYVGRESIDVAGRSVEAYHEVDTDPAGDSSDLYCDDDGNTLLMTASNGFKEVRVWDPKA
jgi:hypothetical protein